MIITISGMPGSGKSTIASILSKKLGMKRYSAGDYRRNMAKKLGLTLEQFNELGEKKEFTDKEADDWQKSLGEKEDNFIIDGRLSFHFIPSSLKIFLNVSPEIGAKRILLHNREEEQFKDKEEALKLWKKRANSDLKRYKKYYNLNPYNKKQYNLVIDSSRLTIEQITDKILKWLKEKEKNQRRN